MNCGKYAALAMNNVVGLKFVHLILKDGLFGKLYKRSISSDFIWFNNMLYVSDVFIT